MLSLTDLGRMDTDIFEGKNSIMREVGNVFKGELTPKNK